MVKQWVQPPITQNRLPPGSFFIRVPSRICAHNRSYIFAVKHHGYCRATIHWDDVDPWFLPFCTLCLFNIAMV